MAERLTAEAQLDRILHILPLAGREGGASYDELAESLGVSRDQVVRDVEEVTAREYYHPAGSGNDVRIGLVQEKVTVWAPGQFQRPVRFTLREAAALHLGLRLLSAERDDPALQEALREMEERIAWAIPEGIDEQVAIAGDPRGSDAVRALVVRAAKERRRCRIDYLKPDAPEPDNREMDPYAVAYSDGTWYVVGFCHERGEPRIFRIDRIMEAELREESFEVSADFEVADYLSRGRVFRAEEEAEVPVRYGPRIARWLLERGEGEADEDGSVVVTHAVVDPGWLVRHVLQYGPDAEVLEPEEMRELVREGAERVAEGSSS